MKVSVLIVIMPVTRDPGALQAGFGIVSAKTKKYKEKCYRFHNELIQ